MTTTTKLFPEHLAKDQVLLVVRDPWERLLSAYRSSSKSRSRRGCPPPARDKLESVGNADQAAFQSSYGRAMVANFRVEGVSRFGAEVYR